MDVIACSAKPCPIVLSSQCVFYEGPNLVYTGINTNDNLEIALQKIDAKFGDAFIGYIFNNGITQDNPGDPVQLGGPLVENTTITSGGFNLLVTGSLEAGAHVTTGGTSSDFVKGDGSLDPGPYQPAGSYISALTGDGTATGPGSAPFTLATVNAAPGVYGSGSQKLSLNVKYWLNDMAKKVKEQKDQCEALKNELIKKYGEEKDGMIQISMSIKAEDGVDVINPAFVSFQNEFQKLLSEERELEYKELKLSDIGDIETEESYHLLFSLLKVDD